MSGPPGRAVDVAVIGGGIVGASAAAFLAEAGVRVRLYEREAIAAAASGRNSGVVQHPFDPALAGLHRETVGHYRAIAEEPAANGFALADEPAGLLALGHGEAAPAVEALAAAWRATHPDIAVGVVGAAELRDLEPGLAPGLVACRLTIGYPVAPAAATRAFAAVAAARGGELRIGADASVVIRDGAAAGVEVDGSFEPAGSVVVAAGPRSPDVVDPTGRWRPIVASWGVVATIRLAAPPRHVLEEATIDAGEGHADADVGFSLVPASRESSLGSTFLPTAPNPDETVGELVRRGSAFVPAVDGAPVLGIRVCARPVSVDGRPLVGAVPGVERLYVAAGHGLWGISTGPATARMVADLVLGRDAAIPAALDPARFGPVC